MGAVCGLANPEPAAARVIVPWIDGRKVAIRHGMKGATGNVYAGLQEFADMMFLLHLLREGDLFLDIGANIGSYAVLASGVCRSETWAFEPDPSTRDHLERNVSINDLNGLITVFGCALGAARGDTGSTHAISCSSGTIPMPQSESRPRDASTSSGIRYSRRRT